jgi:hypothetical protein
VEGEETYRFLYSALDGGKWSTSSPGRFNPWEKHLSVPIMSEDEWVPEPVWMI